MLFLVVICVVLFTVNVWRKRKSKNYPPGPRGLPYIGNLLEVLRIIKETGYDWAVWKHFSKLYGSIIRVQMVQAEPLVIISGHDAVFEFLKMREFDGRPNNFISYHRGMGKKRGLLYNDGNDFFEQKRFVLRVLKYFGFGKQTMEELIMTDTNMLCNVINEKHLDKEIYLEKFVDMTSIAILSSLWNLIAGKRCDLNNEDSEIISTVRLMQTRFNGRKIASRLWRYLPFINYIKTCFSEYRKYEKENVVLSNFFLNEISNHDKTRIYGEPRDFIDTYLDKIESSNKDKTSSFDELQLVMILRDFLTAGMETTSIAIGFAIAYLAKYPNVQTKVQQELDQVIGNMDVSRLKDKNLLPYLNATIAEVLRLANIAPTTIEHRAVNNCSILGYDIEKNWTAFGNLRSVHLDSDHWVDAESFWPERFINKDGNFVENSSLIPFGLGRRKCPADTMAKMSLFFFIGNLVKKFEFSLAPKETAPSLLGLNGFPTQPPHIKIVIKSRCNNKL